MNPDDRGDRAARDTREARETSAPPASSAGGTTPPPVAGPTPPPVAGPTPPVAGPTPPVAGPTPPERDEGQDDGPFGGLPESVRHRVESWVPELVKKAVAAGVGAVFTTEESIRKLTKEMPMPKEVAGYLVNTASSTKDELLRIVAREVREFLTNVNLSEEIAKMLTTLSFEIKTEIRFIPNDEKFSGVEPDVKAKVRLKRNERNETRPPRRGVFRRRETGAPDESDPKSGDSNDE